MSIRKKLFFSFSKVYTWKPPNIIQLLLSHDALENGVLLYVYSYLRISTAVLPQPADPNFRDKNIKWINEDK